VEAAWWNGGEGGHKVFCGNGADDSGNGSKQERRRRRRCVEAGSLEVVTSGSW